MSRRQRSHQPYNDLQSIRLRGTLIVGLDQNNLPFSAAQPQPSGIDFEVAELLADELGVSLEVYWAYASHDSYPAKLANKRLCDVILGVMPDDRFAQRVTFSRPYCSADYVYAVLFDNTTVDTSVLLSDFPIAVEPGLAVRGLDGRQIKTFGNLESILKAVLSGKVGAGYVLSSRAHWLAAKQWPDKLSFVRPGPAVDHFPICAAIRRDEAELLDAINAAFDELRRSGRLAQVFARWNVPLNETVTHDPLQP